MARNQTWATIRTAFKAECGVELSESVASGDNARYLALANNTIKWLIGQHAYLLGETPATVALVPGTRYYDFPESTIDIDRHEEPAYAEQSDGHREPVAYGIGQEQYNAYGNETEQRDPVERWRKVRYGGSLKIEVWPIPLTAQTLHLTGIGVFTAMTVDGSTCPIDDMLVVYFMAAKQLARDKAADAQAVLTQAQTHLASLKGTRSSKFEQFNMAGGGEPRRGQYYNRPRRHLD
jgi:hypothetical protein